MKTLIISSSLAPNSRSYLLCKVAEKKLKDSGIDAEILDLREYEIHPVYGGESKDMEKITKKIGKADNYIIGMGIHNYSISDSLKILLDTCMHDCNGKFYGILCAAGGARSYLATTQLTQICMNQRRMIQLPRVVYVTGADFSDDEVSSADVLERMDLFVHEFVDIGKRLIG